MSDNNYYGTLYLVTPGGTSDPERMHEDVVETYQHGRSHIDVAKELWSLAGEDAPAKAIDAVVDHAYERAPHVLVAAEIDELLGLLSGIDDVLRRTVVDNDLKIRPERMPEIRRRARLIDAGEERGDLASGAVWEGLTRVWALRNILKEARDRGLDVALD